MGRGDRGQIVAEARRRLARVDAGGEVQTGEAGKEAGKGIEQHFLPLDADAHRARGGSPALVKPCVRVQRRSIGFERER
jgi:hypothetical protein